MVSGLSHKGHKAQYILGEAMQVCSNFVTSGGAIRLQIPPPATQCRAFLFVRELKRPVPVGERRGAVRGANPVGTAPCPPISLRDSLRIY